MTIQPTMQKIVNWLQANGYHTTDSGDGVANVEAGMEGALEFPHVFMVVDRDEMVAEADRLLALCVEAKILDPECSEGNIEVTYSPVDGLGILALYGVTDEVFNG